MGAAIARWSLGTLARVLSCVALLLCNAAGYADTFKVGVVPQFTTQVINDIWQPVLKELGARTGHRFTLEIEPDITKFEVAFERGDYDFAYMNPWHAVTAHEKQAYIPLVRDGAKRLTGILVVAADSPIRDVSELDGAEIAFPSPNALSASLLMRTELATLQGLDISALYVRTHPAVYLNVALGKSVAGGGVLRTLRSQPQELQDRVRVLYETREVAPHPFVAHPRVPVAPRAEIAAALLTMGNDPSLQSLFDRIPMQKASAASIEDYLPLLEWGLQDFYVSN